MKKALFICAVLLPGVALAAAPQTFSQLVSTVIGVLNGFTTFLIAAGLAIYFYGISTNILKFGEGDKEKFKAYFFWGIIVLFVMVSIWGILRLLQTSLFGTSSGNTSDTQQQQSQFQQPQLIE